MSTSVHLICTDCGVSYATAEAANAHQERLAFTVSFITVKRDN